MAAKDDQTRDVSVEARLQQRGITVALNARGDAALVRADEAIVRLTPGDEEDLNRQTEAAKDVLAQLQLYQRPRDDKDDAVTRTGVLLRVAGPG